MEKITFHLGTLEAPVQASQASVRDNNIINRLWEKDPTIWHADEVHQRSILNRLGWLTSIELMQSQIGELTAFAGDMKAAGFTHAVVLGMGGSSLCPDVCRATFGSAPGFPQLLVLDSTDPVSVARVEGAVPLATTLFIVASKSGGTMETNMFYKYFYGRVADVKNDPGENFIAVTDAGTKMEAIAKEKKFRKIFVNPADIGGRFSALSYFGLVPMALIGMDIMTLLANAAGEAARSRDASLEANAAAKIGIVMGEAYKAGKDKLTFITSPAIGTFSCWTEQLVAESTGKEGKGIVPVEGEDLPAMNDTSNYSMDRLFVMLLLEQDAERFEPLMKALIADGRPLVSIVIDNPYGLGAEFFRWEFATAIAGAVMQIDPFDEPNVKESKDNTVRVIEEYSSTGALPARTPAAVFDSLRFICGGEYGEKLAASVKDAGFKRLLSAHLTASSASDYIAILAYVDRNETNRQLLQAIREKVRAATGCAVTLGFGPRYLHSTGQLHKGGQPNGIFLLVTADEPIDIPIPGEKYSFDVLKNAQAIGDERSLSSRSLRAAGIHLGSEIEKGLREVASLL